MRKLFLILAAVACLGLAGCGAKRLSPQEAEAAFGPLPENYRELIRAAVPQYLIDPTSALIYFDGHPLLEPPYGSDTGDARAGWHVYFQVNAKNRMGGYTGKKFWVCNIRNGQVTMCYGGK